VIDYSLARRATLTELFTRGVTSFDDACDAHPTAAAARFHGEPTRQPCPVCRRENLTHVTYVYGDELGQYSDASRRPRARGDGARARRVHGVRRRGLPGMLMEPPGLSYVLGDGTPANRLAGAHREDD